MAFHLLIYNNHFPPLRPQALEAVRGANGGVLPSLDSSFVDQITKLMQNGFGGGLLNGGGN
jgi:hypothetical protein